MNDDIYLEVTNLSKKIKNQLVLDNINLKLSRGKIYGFKGKNGSGKTMLFRTICGLVRPTQGMVHIDKEKLGEDISFPNSVGVLIEYPSFLPGYTGLKNLKMIAEIKRVINEQQIKDILVKVGLNPNDKRKYKKYSLGMKQRLGIAQALMEDPDLVILDEPTNALDSEGIVIVKDLLINLKKKNKTILIASHENEHLELLCDEIFIIDNGKIIDHQFLKEKAQ